MHEDVTKILFSAEEIDACVKRMGAQISADFAGEKVLLITVLKGAFVFMADLVRAIEGDVEIDFMAVSSYGAEAKSSGIVRIIKDLEGSIEGRHVLIVEDILDSGLTLRYLSKNLKSRGPLSVGVATLLLKEGKQETDVTCKYVGLRCPDEFVVGYGLDYAERYRNLPYIGILDPKVYS
ncbi:MAG: hypoxanthine phosphoribosyltransferase [Coriobacteriales bacterium]|jgi:hypoxanthine phosphoribosyltransferase|nr:hypoxanthine phosphoribosyltransferase [Coriobacteriales bacterium]